MENKIVTGKWNVTDKLQGSEFEVVKYEDGTGNVRCLSGANVKFFVDETLFEHEPAGYLDERLFNITRLV